MSKPILGFTGASAEKRALKASRLSPPRTYTLPDGSLVGVGKAVTRLVDGEDRIDIVIRGARLTSAYIGDFTRPGGARAWLDLTTVERARQAKRMAR